MDPNETAAALDAMQQQVLQSMLEHQIVVQALHEQCAVFGLYVVASASLVYYLIRRLVCLSAGSVEQERRHSHERCETAKRNSLEQSATLMQSLHAFEGLLSAKRKGSAG